MISGSKLVYAYNDYSSFSFPNVTCNTGDSLVILGPSGCGKSTLLYLLSGLIKPHQGSIIIDNIDISTLPQKKLDQFRANNFGLIFQQAYFYKALNVRQNLEMHYTLSQNKVDTSRMEELLHKLNLSKKINANIQELSAGELQRLALIRAILLKPKIILADEPSSALDDHNANAIIQLLKELAHENNSSLIIVTHDHRISTAFQNRLILS